MGTMSILLLIIYLSLLVKPFHIYADPTILITAATDQPTYHLRQTVNVSGTLIQDGSPVPDALISIEVRNLRGDPYIFRTIPIGNPTESWAIEITEAKVCDSLGNPIDKAKIKSLVQLCVTMHNNYANTLTGFITATVCDGNLIPIATRWSPFSLSANDYELTCWTCYIPEWAYTGKATVHCNVYRDFPQNLGTPYTPETKIEFYITRNLEQGNPHSLPKSSYTTYSGHYSTFFKVSPDRYALLGTYAVYVTGRISPILRTQASTTYNTESDLCPPEASFTYTPLKVYQNMTVTFDASSSSAEGYNDTIIRYKWNINDPYNPEQIIKQGTYTNPPSPLATHTFQYPGTYTVDLNVTDNEGLWATATKPISILPEFGPTANFTWDPPNPIIEETVTFDASSSETGWSAKTKSFSPIQSYVWNFSDGTGNITTSNPIINHAFTEPKNYTVRLTVIDGVGRSDATWNIVEVQNVTLKDYDLNGDGVIDGEDIFIVARAFGSAPGHPDWDPRADVNKDGVVDGDDLFPVARHFGEDP